MKNLSLILLFITSPLFSQEFSTTFKFKDAIGNQDSIIVGYSPLATDSIDISFDEKNLYESEIDTSLCVYASNVVVLDGGYYIKPNFRTKKQIVLLLKPEYIKYAGIDIICQNFPLVVKWYKNLFSDTSRSKSFITPIPPGAWFDAGESPFLLKYSDSIIYQDSANWQSRYYYDSINGSKIKILKLYIGFVSESNKLKTPSKEYKKALSLFPNPCNNIVHLRFENVTTNYIQLFDSQGKLWFISKIDNNKEFDVDVSNFPKGIYILKIYNNNYYYFNKLIKF